MPDEGPLGWLERAYETTPEEVAKLGLDEDEKRAILRAELRALGLVGTIVLLAKPQAPDPEVAREAVAAVSAALEEVAGKEGTLADKLARYAEKKGARGKELARKVVGRALHDLYGLEGHGLTADDVLRALDFAGRLRGEADAREVARTLARFGKTPSRAVLGHLEEQIGLVHRLKTEELMPSELDKPILEFAPRIFAWRLPSMLKGLLPGEAKVRLAFVLWGRLRGIAVSKDGLVHALDALTPQKPVTLLEALLPLDRKPLLAVAASAEARLIEDAARIELPS